MIDKISLKNIRRFEQKSLDITNKKVLLCGGNAVGKTTILEAIYLTSRVRSQRTSNLSELISYGKQFGEVKIRNNQNQFSVILSKTGKCVSINQSEIARISDYIGQNPTIFFSPYNLSIVTDSPAIRRQFLNQEISQLFSSHLKRLNIYNKLLQERNALLKANDGMIDDKMLSVLTGQLIEAGKVIIKDRKKFVEQINEKINLTHHYFSNDEIIKLQYLPSVDIENIETIFSNKQETDLITKTTNYGPHRDDLIFLINDKNLAKYGSQGQIRSTILSLKITLCRLYYDVKKEYPILLLDDVLSELDVNRQNCLLKLVDELGQTFISTVDVSIIDSSNLRNYQLINL